MNILGIIAVPIFGYLIVSALWRGKSLWENLAYGYLVGWPLFTLILFIGNWLGLQFATLESSLVLLVALSIVITARYLLKIPLSINIQRLNIKHLPGREAWLTILIVLILAVSLGSDFYRIVAEWDALTLYDFRARLFAQDGHMSSAIAAQGKYFFSYPPHTSLAHTWYYLLGFANPMSFYAGVFISFAIAFYYAIRRHGTRLLSLLTVLMLLISPHLFWHSQIPYTNLPYTVSIVLGTILVIEWIRRGHTSDLVMGALLTGISIWVRHTEPFWLTNLLLVAGSSIYRRTPLPLLLYSAIFFPLERVWKIFSATMRGLTASGPLSEVSGGIASVSTGVSLDQLLIVTQFLIANVFRPYAPSFLIFVLFLLYKFARRERFWIAEIVVFANIGLLFAGTYIFSLSQSYWQEIPGSLQRISMIFTPLILYCLGTTARKS